MRLLDTATLKFQEFYGEIPDYAILSHRWEEEEITFKQLENLSPDVEKMKGFQKVKKFCSVAKEEGYVWAWVDTCCIDKSSSAELSEAINSMFSWYQNAHVCFAFLADVEYDGPEFSGVFDDEDIESTTLSMTFALSESSWFLRGWTLQELIAPDELYFYTSKWRRMASKKEIATELADITRIPKEVLLRDSDFPLRSYSASARIYWASRRKTTRIEDEAYSLLGLLDINMPLLYGEGNKAFRRFQEEILKQLNDTSVFAASGPNVLAESPRDYNHPHCSKVECEPRRSLITNSWDPDKNYSSDLYQPFTFSRTLIGCTFPVFARMNHLPFDCYAPRQKHTVTVYTDRDICSHLAFIYCSFERQWLFLTIDHAEHRATTFHGKLAFPYILALSEEAVTNLLPQAVRLYLVVPDIPSISSTYLAHNWDLCTLVLLKRIPTNDRAEDRVTEYVPLGFTPYSMNRLSRWARWGMQRNHSTEIVLTFKVHDQIYRFWLVHLILSAMVISKLGTNGLPDTQWRQSKIRHLRHHGTKDSLVQYITLPSDSKSNWCRLELKQPPIPWVPEWQNLDNVSLFSPNKPPKWVLEIRASSKDMEPILVERVEDSLSYTLDKVAPSRSETPLSM